MSGPEAILDDLVNPLSACLSHEGAQQVAGLRASPTLQSQIHQLGQKCNRGELTDDERQDYETIVRFTKFISVLQSKARRQLRADASE